MCVGGEPVSVAHTSLRSLVEFLVYLLFCRVTCAADVIAEQQPASSGDDEEQKHIESAVGRDINRSTQHCDGEGAGGFENAEKRK